MKIDDKQVVIDDAMEAQYYIKQNALQQLRIVKANDAAKLASGEYDWIVIAPGTKVLRKLK